MSGTSVHQTGPGRVRENGLFGQLLPSGRKLLRWVVGPIANLLLAAAVRRRVKEFLQDVRVQMHHTLSTLHPEVVPGATDRSGEYIEVYLNFAAYRIRITREFYNRQQYQLWADVGSSSDPCNLFRIDFVMDCLNRLDDSGVTQGVSKLPATLAQLELLITSAHNKLAEQLGPSRYAQTTMMIRQVIHEYSVSGHGKDGAVNSSERP